MAGRNDLYKAKSLFFTKPFWNDIEKFCATAPIT